MPPYSQAGPLNFASVKIFSWLRHWINPRFSGIHLRFSFFFPWLDVMPFPTTPSTRGKRAGQELKNGTSKSP